MALNEQQAAAVDAVMSWLTDKEADPFFLLGGSAGTGKTFTMQEIVRRVRGRVVFTAPTNKATRVLRLTLTREDYRPECKTIYSLLGLTMAANGEVKEIATPEEPVDLSKYTLVVIDEISMAGRQLFDHIQTAAENFGVRFLLLGDPAQLPPVGELESPAWTEVYDQALLTKVMRQDNQILTLATMLREKVKAPMSALRLVNDHDDVEGVFVRGQAMELDLIRMAESGLLSKPDGGKVIAWRNVTVDRYNQMARRAIFGNEAIMPWLAEDRVIFTGPARDLENQPIAATDDEGTVLRASEGWHPIFAEFKIWSVTISLDEGGVVTARVLHPEHAVAFSAKKEALAAEARKNGRRWKAFWEFQEAFHGLRHAYAITAHRSQGSTYHTALVDWRDILLNKNRAEAMRCLYVAATRPKKVLIFN